MKVLDNNENLMRCLCPNCPTYGACMKTEEKTALYCARNSTRCAVDKQGCICGECPVGSDYRLNDMYYCVIGKA